MLSSILNSKHIYANIIPHFLWSPVSTIRSLLTAGALAFKHEVPDAEIHLLNSGHFALDEQADTIATLVQQFLGKIHDY